MPPSQDAASLTQLGVIGVILLVVLFYAGTMIMPVAISKKRENADASVTAGYSTASPAPSTRASGAP